MDVKPSGLPGGPENASSPAPGQSSASRARRDVFWVIAQFVLIFVFLFAPGLPIYEVGDLPFTVRYVYQLAAFVLFLVGLYIMTRGIINLSRNLTPLPSPRENSWIVQNGIYSLVRHPIYTGILLACLAYALRRCSVTHFALWIVLMWFFDRKSRYEEAKLEEKHPEYAEYAKTAKRFFPYIY